jgi:glycosyltransferase involved in cell wall biosynthesis
LLSEQEGYRRAGIHQYISQILAHLPVEDDLEYFVYTRHAALAQKQNCRVIRSRWPTERRQLRILWEQTMWPMYAIRDHLDLLHSMAFVTPVLSKKPAVVTVYDLSFMHYPERFVPFQRRYLTSQTRRSCRQARRVVAISESGREDVQQFFGVPAERIDVIHPGVSPSFNPRSAEQIADFRRRQGLPERFLLHVGTLQPRKNIPALIAALARLADKEIALYLVGGKGWLYEEVFAQVAELGLQRRVHHVGYVADGDLPLWYNAASLLVSPSVYEGFGMPIVEAMACGTLVVAANIAAAPEAAGDAALYFDPEDIEALAGQIERALVDSDLAGRQMASVYRTALQG